MQKAPKEKNWFIVIVALIASALLPCANTTASSTHDLHGQTRAELSAELGQNGVERFAFKPANRVENYDAAWGIASGSTLAPGRALTVFDPVFAAKQTLKGGRVHADDLRRLIPDGTPNTFRPSCTIADGSKFRFNVNGKRVEIKWHAPDANAAARFPGSRSGSQWTAQIKIGNKLLGSDGVLYRRPSDLTHIPIDF